MLKKLKKQVYKANMMLPQHGLVTFTWGNASGIDRTRNLMVIKPSGVDYNDLAPEDLVVLDLHTGEVVEGKLKPSSDAETHLELYRRFPNIGGVVHTHSRWATIFAQAKKEIPVFGTTHADYFHGAVPCSRHLSIGEINANYELETGSLIVETCQTPDKVPAVLVAGHGPFTWGKNSLEAAHNAVVLEEVAFMAWHTLQATPLVSPISQELLDKHYFRKHGTDSYYGQ